MCDKKVFKKIRKLRRIFWIFLGKNKCSPTLKSTQLFIAHMYRTRSISSAKFYEYRHHQVFLCLPFRLKKKGQFLSVSFVENIHCSSPLTILSGNNKLETQYTSTLLHMRHWGHFSPISEFRDRSHLVSNRIFFYTSKTWAEQFTVRGEDFVERCNNLAGTYMRAKIH
jgi:hypothetical protein